MLAHSPALMPRTNLKRTVFGENHYKNQLGVISISGASKVFPHYFSLVVTGCGVRVTKDFVLHIV